MCAVQDGTAAAPRGPDSTCTFVARAHRFFPVFLPFLLVSSRSFSVQVAFHLNGTDKNVYFFMVYTVAKPQLCTERMSQPSVAGVHTNCS